VHCWMFESIVQGIIAARMEGIPALAAPHALLGSFRIGNNKAWEVRMVRKALAMADLTLFASHTMAIDFSSAGWVDPAWVRVVQNGVDCDTFQPAASGEGMVTVGRYSAGKGFPELEQVLRMLRKDFPTLRCLAAGGGEHPDLEGIEFTGFVADVRQVLGRGAIYITTSQSEGLSCALLEAQAMGLPAVARNIGSNSEVIEPGVNGFLAESHDEFRDQCRILLTDHNIRSDMGQKARERMVADFSIQRQVERIESVYSELL
ncbi:MAG TPA: glycosyltransferase, partial [Acidobacteriota bacterium]|nr:glycosyltransferase [Acidobacteriota bacterium]